MFYWLCWFVPRAAQMTNIGNLNQEENREHYVEFLKRITFSSQDELLKPCLFLFVNKAQVC